MLTNKIKKITALMRSTLEGGIMLFVFTMLAILLANSDWRIQYNSILSMLATLSIGEYSLSLSIKDWTNDGLMTLFFLSVGLEIKKEMISGHLVTIKQRLLPGITACAGVALPVCIYSAINYNNAQYINGWAIPAATDIAFTLGIISLLAKKVPHSLKIFVTALAIIDDMIAIVIIALFYSSTISAPMLSYALMCIVALFILNFFNINKLSIYAFITCILWYCLLKSGIHATMAGIILGALIPFNVEDRKKTYVELSKSPLLRLEAYISRAVSYFIVPLFVLINCGICMDSISYKQLTSPLTLGIAIGLFVGKQIGIFLIAFVTIKTKLIQMPKDANFTQLYGVSVLCGIGFTMSLFVSLLSFNGAEALLTEAKLGIIMGSFASMLLGSLILKSAHTQN